MHSPTSNQPMLYSCGSNSDGQLSHGPGNTSDCARFLPVTPSPPGTPLSLACGARHSLLIITPPPASASATLNQLHVCGSNFEGQLGPALAGETRGEPVTEFRRLRLEDLGVGLEETGWEPVEVAACSETSFIVCRWRGEGEPRDDVLVAMGADDWGERAGAGGAKDGPRMVGLQRFGPDGENRWDAPSSMRVSKLAAGPRHAVAVLQWEERASGRPTGWRKAVGWGAARHGQLGAGVVDAEGKALARSAGPVELLDSDGPVLRGFRGVAGLALGMEHTALLLESVPPALTAPSLVLLGSSRKGQLGPDAAGNINHLAIPLVDRPTTALTEHQVGCAWATTFVLSVPDCHPASVFACGNNHHAQLAAPPATTPVATALQPIRLPPPAPGTTRTIRRLAAGSEHVLLWCTVSEPGGQAAARRDEVWAWGWNEHGNLSTGGLDDGQTPQRVWPLPGQPPSRVKGVWAGNATSWIATGPGCRLPPSTV